MTIHHCDLCKAEITFSSLHSNRGYVLGRSVFARYELCINCGKPLEALLKSLESTVIAEPVA